MSEVLKVQRPTVNLDDYERRLYATASNDQRVDDPLAELSRIVGKSDPFKGLFANAPASARQEPSVDIFNRPQTAPPVQSGAASVLKFSLPLTGAAPQSPAPVMPADTTFAPQPRHFDANEKYPTGAETAYSPHYFDELERNAAETATEGDFFSHIAPGFEEQMPEEPDLSEQFAPEKRGRSLLGRSVLVGVLLMGGIGFAGFIGLRGNIKQAADGSVPVIKAATTPVKVEPSLSDADKAKQEEAAALAANDANAKVITKEEQPVEIVQPPGQPPIKIARIIPLSGEQAKPAPAGAIPDAKVPGAPVPEAGYPAPRTVKTVSVRPDGSIIGGTKPAAAAPAPQPAPPTSVAALIDGTDTPPQPANVPLPTSRPNIPLMAVNGTPGRMPLPAATTPKVAKPTTPKTSTRALPVTKPAEPNSPLQLTPVPARQARPARVQTAEATPAETPATSGTYAVQMAAPGSEAEAKSTASRLQSQFADALSGYRLASRKADLGGGRIVYRVRVNNLSKDDALALCEKLHGAGGQCFVSR